MITYSCYSLSLSPSSLFRCDTFSGSVTLAASEVWLSRHLKIRTEHLTLSCLNERYIYEALFECGIPILIEASIGMSGRADNGWNAFIILFVAPQKAQWIGRPPSIVPWLNTLSNVKALILKWNTRNFWGSVYTHIHWLHTEQVYNHHGFRQCCRRYHHYHHSFRRHCRHHYYHHYQHHRHYYRWRCRRLCRRRYHDFVVVIIIIIIIIIITIITIITFIITIIIIIN